MPHPTLFRPASLVLAFVLFTAAVPASAQSPFVGVWQNQLGSYLVVQSVDPGTGLISGYYINMAAGWSCQGTPYAIAGWAFGPTITFSVLWNNSVANCNSQTAWTGLLASGQITAPWNLVTASGQFLTGRDVFHSYSQVSHPSPHPSHRKQ